MKFHKRFYFDCGKRTFRYSQIPRSFKQSALLPTRMRNHAQMMVTMVKWEEYQITISGTSTMYRYTAWGQTLASTPLLHGALNKV